ncbi:hypothetical protein K0M31_014562 [Melipona bicolor]|uniref:Uncharacterized protein n=1 Tax=Melipona bicolor TaxID=60889 RepID=A0AA40G8S7_9HYME|nr:hypothetical protein K0M31_014562 [Melipona bicolor]
MFFLVISHRRVQKKKKATNCYIRFGHSLWSADQLPARGVKPWPQRLSTEIAVSAEVNDKVAGNERCVELDSGSRSTLEDRCGVTAEKFVSRSITKGRGASRSGLLGLSESCADTRGRGGAGSAGTANPYYAFEPTKMLLHDITMPRFPITSGYLAV